MREYGPTLLCGQTTHTGECAAPGAGGDWTALFSPRAPNLVKYLTPHAALGTALAVSLAVSHEYRTILSRKVNALAALLAALGGRSATEAPRLTHASARGGPCRRRPASVDANSGGSWPPAGRGQHRLCRQAELARTVSGASSFRGGGTGSAHAESRSTSSKKV